MADRLTTDDETVDAARLLARRYGCSLSEAVRRAVIRERNALRLREVPPHAQEERRRTLERLFELFEGSDAVQELKRLKSEDAGF